MPNGVHNKCPESLGNVYKQSISNRTNNFIIEKCKNKFLSKFPSNVLPTKWNELSLDLKSEASIKKFKKRISSEILDSYCQNESCKRDICVDCRR